jgi:DNA mismatch repair ATPase MutS
MIFHSILYKNEKTSGVVETETSVPPDFFTDLNLNHVIDEVVILKEEYHLKPFFYSKLNNLETILYRQEIMRDLENVVLLEQIKSFEGKMHDIRLLIARSDKNEYQHQKERFFLDAVEMYCETVTVLAENFKSGYLKSEGLLNFQNYLLQYLQSNKFYSLQTESKHLLKDLSSIKYSILTKDLHVKVQAYKAETDYSEEVEKLFDRFKQESVKDYRVNYPFEPEMNHIEAAILKGVSILFPEIFKTLDGYYKNNQKFLDETIKIFDREIQFYISYLEYIIPLKKAGLKFCYPEISNTDKDVCNYEGFDLALAHKLFKQSHDVVTNDFSLKNQERIIVVTGPNQGGKTTFSRTFGQLHFIANLGLPVPGRKAKLFLYDKLLTHFEKEEKIQNLRSKFEDDLVRIHDILKETTPQSIIIMNEILSSTSLQDAIYLSKKIMERIAELDVLCVWVTFIDELTTLSEKNVSMTSTVVFENPAMRTFKIIRQPSDGLAYAISIAKKYRVTYDDLKQRIKA